MIDKIDEYINMQSDSYGTVPFKPSIVKVGLYRRCDGQYFDVLGDVYDANVLDEKGLINTNKVLFKFSNSSSPEFFYLAFDDFFSKIWIQGEKGEKVLASKFEYVG